MGAETTTLISTKTLNPNSKYILEIYQQVSSNSGNFTTYKVIEKATDLLIAEGNSNKNCRTYKTFLKQNQILLTDIDIHFEKVRWTWE